MRRDAFLAIAILVAILGALAAKSLLVSLPAVPTHPTAEQFDANRAKARLARVLGDQRPHPADSAADDAVRSRLVAELQGMGLRPIVRDQSVCNDFQKARLIACARVRNVIAIIGPASGKALLLASHYDSVPVGPGAADDGIGVATMLEVASILKNRPLKRPLIFLFDEGEELGLVGARAFLVDPLSRNVGSLLNLEARGVTGPATMFETSQPNGAAIATFAKAVDRPVASSLSTDIVRLIPNDTDVSTFKERGWTTLNFAVTGNETRYHSPGDDLAALDARSLQHMGDQALAVASELSADAPAAASGQRIFFDVLGRFLIQMPLWLGAVALAALLIAFAALAWRRDAVVRAPLTILVAILAAVAAAWLSSALMGVLRSGTFWRASPELTFLSMYASEILAAVAVLRTLGRPVSREQMRAAFWFVFLVLGALAAIATPGAIIYFLFPPLVVLIGVALGRRSSVAETTAALVAIVLLYLSWGEMLGQLEELFTPGPLWIVAPVAAIIILPPLIEATPVFARAGRGVAIAGSAALALIGWAVVAATPAYSSDRQQRFTIEHVTDAAKRGSQWAVLNDGAGLPAGYPPLGQWHRGKVAYSDRPRWLARAPAIPGVQPPAAQLIESVVNGSERAVRLRLHANGAERIALIAPADARIRSAGVPGFIRPLGSAESSGKFTISCTGRSCDGLELSIDFGTAAPVKLVIIGSRNGLPPTATPLLAARPKLARPQYTSDETVAVAHLRV